MMRPPPRPLPAPHAHALRALVPRRRQVGQRRTAARHRLQRASQRLHVDSQAPIARRERRLARSDHDVAAASQSGPLGRVTAKRLPRTPGVGPVLSRTLVAEGPAWGALHRQEIAVLVGVAPFNRESGTGRGKQSIWGERAHGRAVLSMSTLTAVRHNTGRKACYARLRAAAKAAKVALTASMRTRLTILNAMIKHRTRWQEKRLRPLDHQDSCSPQPETNWRTRCVEPPLGIGRYAGTDMLLGRRGPCQRFSALTMAMVTEPQYVCGADTQCLGLLIKIKPEHIARDR